MPIIYKSLNQIIAILRVLKDVPYLDIDTKAIDGRSHHGTDGCHPSRNTTPNGFVGGLVWSYLYGSFIAIIWVPLYEMFDRRFQSEE